MKKRIFKTSLRLKVQLSVISSFFKVFLLILLVGFSLPAISEEDSQPAPGDQAGNEEESTESKVLDAIIQRCEEKLKRVEKETVGMDMASYALISQVANQATSAAGSAKIAHQGSGAINTALAASTLKRCTKCKTAINKCKDDCDTENQCQTILLSSETNIECLCSEESNFGCKPDDTDCIQKCGADCKKCETSLEETLKGCEGFSSKCGDVCLQAGLSGVQAVTNMMAARQLGGCDEGEDCDTSLPKKKSETPLFENPKGLSVNPPNLSSSVNTGSGLSKSKNLSGAPYIPKTDTTQTDASKEDDKKKDTIAGSEDPYYGRESLNDGIKGVGFKPNSASLTGAGVGASPFGNQDGLNFKNGDSKKDKKNSVFGKSALSGGSVGFGSGGKLAGYKAASSLNRLGGSSKKGKNSLKKSNRGVSGEMGMQGEGTAQNLKDSIFERASHFIKVVCSSEKC